MQKICHEARQAVGDKDDPILQGADQLERTAPTDDYSIEQKLYPNIDFLIGIT